MNFYIVFCKNRKKFDKYVKINRIKNKIIIDIKNQLEENQIKDKIKFKDYFNLIIYTKIIQSIDKNKDVYYIPNFYDENLNINEIIKLKKYTESSNFNALMFFDEFGQDDKIFKEVISKLDSFDCSQIIRDY
jgi:hypothetical protein